MTKLLLRRFYSNGESTVGELFLNYNQHLCYVLEDEVRRTKVKGETCIPEGLYNVGLHGNPNGKFVTAYKKRWTWHNEVLEIKNVSGFSDVLIHTGNRDEHTAGCLLVGKALSISAEENTVNISRPAYIEVYKACYEAAKNGELQLMIETDIVASKIKE